jgi:hypothetical protein
VWEGGFTAKAITATAAPCRLGDGRPIPKDWTWVASTDTVVGICAAQGVGASSSAAAATAAAAAAAVRGTDARKRGASNSLP